MLAVDNMSGDEDEIIRIRKILESIIENTFDKIEIPAAWLLFSLYLRSREQRTMSLGACEEVARKLSIEQ